MSDIVERLRNFDPMRANSREAADEIERLRRELNLLKAVHESAEAEVRQLRAALQEIKVLSWTTPEGHHIQDIARRALEERK